MTNTIIAILPAFLRRYTDRVRASPIGYRLAKGAFWSLAGATISRGLGLASSIVVARFLGKEGFGELGVIHSTIGLFGTFAGFGLGLTATKHVAEFRDKAPVRAGRIIALSSLVATGTGGVMAVLLVVLAPWMAAHTLAAPHLANLLRIGAALLFLGALNGAQTGALAGYEAFKTIAKVNVLAGLSAFPLMVGGVYLAGLEGAVWGLVASMGINWLLNHLALRREAKQASVPLAFTGCLGEWKVLWTYSLPAVLSGTMVGPVNWVCVAMLVNQPNGYAENGLYNAANQWFWAVMMLPGFLGQAVLPILSEQIGKDQWHRSGRILRLSMTVNAVAVCPAVIVGCVVSPLIMGFYGAAFAGGWPVLVAVLLTAGLDAAVQIPVGQFIAASGRMWTGCLTNAGWAAAVLMATWLSVKWGAMGLASARFGVYAVHSIGVFVYAYALIKRHGQQTSQPFVGRPVTATVSDEGLGQ